MIERSASNGGSTGAVRRETENLDKVASSHDSDNIAKLKEQFSRASTFRASSNFSTLVSDELQEKIRLVLVAKRDQLLARQFKNNSDDERTLIEWVEM